MIKRLSKCIGEYKKQTVITPLLIAVEVVVEVLIPFLMASLIDNGTDAGNMAYVLKLGAVLVAASVVSMLLGILAGKTSALAAAGFARNMRKEIYYSVQKFSFKGIDKYSASGLVTRLTTDVNNVQNAFMMIIRLAVRSPLMLTFSLIMSFSINTKLALIFLCATPILGGALYLIIRIVHPIFQRVFKTYDKLNKVVQENVRGMRVVKSFVREEHETQKFGAVNTSIYKDFTKAEKILAFNSPIMQFCMYACMLLVSWFGARLVVGGDLTTGQLTSLFTYAIQILSSLMMLSMVFVMIMISRASAERIVEVLNETPDLTDAENPVCEISDGSVQFVNVDFSYVNDENKLVLSRINLDIKAGQTIGVIGGTGAGKSSLIQLIPRLYDVTGGTVRVGGTDVRAINSKTLREQIAVVLQKNVLFSGTIKENLCWGNAEATDEQLKHACVLAQADGFIQSFEKGYNTYIEQGGANLSGGQKQRLCIARALLKNPKILILDDSTSAVDTKTDALIRKAFKEEIPQMTKIIIAQRISSVSEADMIIVMDGGKISGTGKHDELLKNNEIYRDVYLSQVKGAANE